MESQIIEDNNLESGLGRTEEEDMQCNSNRTVA